MLGKIDLRLGRIGISEAVDLEAIVMAAKDAPILSQSQAKNTGEPYYWSGRPCSKGHYSFRRTDSGVCRACNIIAARGVSEAKKLENADRREAKLVRKNAQIISHKERGVFLEEYAKCGNLELASKKVGLTVPKLQVYLARFPDFGNAVTLLEKRLREQGILKFKDESSKKSQTFEWDDDKRDILIRVYVDTGDIAAARDAAGCTASIYINELETNEVFRENMKKAEPKAMQILEERAIQFALGGNDKLLQAILKAKKPNEYGDKIKIEQNTKITLPDDQMIARIQTLMNRGLIIDVDSEPVSEHESEGPRRITSDSGRVKSTKDVQ